MTDPSDPYEKQVRAGLARIKNWLDDEEAREAAAELEYPHVVVCLNDGDPDSVYVIGPYDTPAEALALMEFYQQCDQLPTARAMHARLGKPRYIVRPLQPHDS
jgi:sugar phosphate isomerase/epimerase